MEENMQKRGAPDSFAEHGRAPTVLTCNVGEWH